MKRSEGLALNLLDKRSCCGRRKAMEGEASQDEAIKTWQEKTRRRQTMEMAGRTEGQSEKAKLENVKDKWRQSIRQHNIIQYWQTVSGRGEINLLEKQVIFSACL